MDIEPYEFLDFYPIFVYGSVQFVEWCSRHPALSPWISFSGPAFEPREWYNAYSNNILNHPNYYSFQHFLEKYEKLSDLEYHLLNKFHARPVRDHKIFTGGVFDISSFSKLNIPSHTQVAISPVVNGIKAEFRVWVVGEKPVACSQYRAFGAADQLSKGYFVDEAIRFVEEIDFDFMNSNRHFGGSIFPENRVVDLALVDGGAADHWKVIEINPIHCSGWYAVDLGIIVDSYLEYYSKIQS